MVVYRLFVNCMSIGVLVLVKFHQKYGFVILMKTIVLKCDINKSLTGVANVYYNHIHVLWLDTLCDCYILQFQSF